jgi:HAD superfamily hydrolase (TIGR01459 family)
MTAPSSAARTVPVLHSIGEIAGEFDAFIIDLWGVIHDGERPYPGVLDALAAMRQNGRRVCLLSNAPRRVTTVTEKLRGMGVPDEAYDGLMSSGEATYRALRDRPDSFHAALGRDFYHIGADWDVDVFAGLPFKPVAMQSASWVLNSGIKHIDEPLEAYEETLLAARARRLPMVCANPDLVVMQGERMGICAGAIAERYEALGGSVAYHGKPHPDVYAHALALVGDPAPDRVLAIGDSFRTDIRGGQAAGFATLFVTQGIHAEELMVGGAPDSARVSEAAMAAGLRAPDFAMASLVW